MVSTSLYPLPTNWTTPSLLTKKTEPPSDTGRTTHPLTNSAPISHPETTSLSQRSHGSLSHFRVLRAFRGYLASQTSREAGGNGPASRVEDRSWGRQCL